MKTYGSPCPLDQISIISFKRCPILHTVITRILCSIWKSTNERENQLLLNCFSRRCQWACIIIRVDKCAVFGIKKFSTSSLQFQPRLLINSEVIPPVKQGESFKHLGRFFNFDMNNKDHKDLALSNLETMLKKLIHCVSIPKTSYFYMNDTFFQNYLGI